MKAKLYFHQGKLSHKSLMTEAEMQVLLQEPRKAVPAEWLEERELRPPK